MFSWSFEVTWYLADLAWLFRTQHGLVWPFMAFYGLILSCMTFYDFMSFQALVWSLYSLVWPFLLLYGQLWLYIALSRGHISKFIWSCFILKDVNFHIKKTPTTKCASSLQKFKKCPELFCKISANISISILWKVKMRLKHCQIKVQSI